MDTIPVELDINALSPLDELPITLYRNVQVRMLQQVSYLRENYLAVSYSRVKGCSRDSQVMVKKGTARKGGKNLLIISNPAPWAMNVCLENLPADKLVDAVTGQKLSVNKNCNYPRVQLAQYQLIVCELPDGFAGDVTLKKAAPSDKAIKGLEKHMEKVFANAPKTAHAKDLARELRTMFMFGEYRQVWKELHNSAFKASGVNAELQRIATEGRM